MFRKIHYKLLKQDKNILSNLSKQQKSKYSNFDFTDAVVFKPWGFEYLFHEDKKLDTCGWMLHINKGFGTSIHCHETKNTTLVVISGLLHLRTVYGKRLMDSGDVALIDKKVFHAMTAVEDDTRVIELETPTLKTDAVRAIDVWKRESEPYESKCLVMSLKKVNYDKHINQHKKLT